MRPWWIIALWISAGSARAEGSGAIVVRMCDDDRASVGLSTQLRGSLSAHGWTVEERPRPSGLRPIRVCAPQTEALRGHFEAGVDCFYKLKLDSARARLEALVQVFDETRSLFGQADLYIDAHFFLAWIAREQKRPRVMAEHFGVVARLRPGWQPPPGRFPPAVVEAYTRVLGATARARPGSLIVDVEPSGARVILDARSSCTAPCELGGLVAGPHFVRVEHPGFEPHVAVVEVTEATRVAGELSVDPRPAIAVAKGDADLIAAAGDAELAVILDAEVERCTLVTRERVARTELQLESILATISTLTRDDAPEPVVAEAQQHQLSLTPRALAGVAVLLDAASKREFEPVGATAMAVLTLEVAPWLGLEVAGGYAGGFAARGSGTGGALLLGMGARFRMAWKVAPFLSSHGGWALTGGDSRVWLDAGIGLDLEVGPVRAGPFLAYLLVFDERSVSMLTAGVAAGL